MSPIHSPITTDIQPTTDSPVLHVLIVEDDADVGSALADAIARPARRVHRADSLADARRLLTYLPVNLVLIDRALPDGDGVEFASELRRLAPAARSIIITGEATFEAALASIRAGAVDFIAKPLDVTDLNHRIDAALQIQQRDQQVQERIGRLRRLCKELNQARHQISQQVDVLCSDLVTAYQDLASQVQHIELVSDLRTSLADELDLEQTLRHTLEFLVNKVGPTNIAIFLPAGDGGQSVGGYVNYSFDHDHMPLVLDYLAENLAPRLSDCEEMVHLADESQLADFLGENAANWLDGHHLLGVNCRDDESETLASIALFRDGAEPFTDETKELLEAVAPLLASHLVKVIRIHHRTENFFGSDENDADDDHGLAA